MSAKSVRGDQRRRRYEIFIGIDRDARNAWLSLRLRSGFDGGVASRYENGIVTRPFIIVADDETSDRGSGDASALTALTAHDMGCSGGPKYPEMGYICMGKTPERDRCPVAEALDWDPVTDISSVLEGIWPEGHVQIWVREEHAFDHGFENTDIALSQTCVFLATIGELKTNARSSSVVSKSLRSENGLAI